jgi:hypothetical protein
VKRKAFETQDILGLNLFITRMGQPGHWRVARTTMLSRRQTLTTNLIAAAKERMSVRLGRVNNGLQPLLMQFLGPFASPHENLRDRMAGACPSPPVGEKKPKR